MVLHQTSDLELRIKDTNTLKIRVYQSATSSVFTEYKLANNILNVGSDDEIYFINEMEDEVYEIFFGDGILGRKLEDGEVVEPLVTL